MKLLPRVVSCNVPVGYLHVYVILSTFNLTILPFNRKRTTRECACLVTLM